MMRCMPKGHPMPWVPFGHVESNEGGFQKLGRSSRASIHYFLAGSLRDLRGFDRDADVWRRSRADEFGRLRSAPRGIGPKSTIQAHSDMASLLI